MDPEHEILKLIASGAQWLSGRVLDSRPRVRGFEPHWRHCIKSLSKNILPSLVLFQHRKTRPFITERLLMGRKNQIKQTKKYVSHQRAAKALACLCIASSEGSGELICFFYQHGQT